MALLLALGIAASAGAADGTIVYSIGEVRVRQSGTLTEAAPGQAVGQGDVVTTGRDGAAVIQLVTGVEVKLRENTVLAMDALGEDTTLSLVKGSLFSRVATRLKGRYTVRTETAVAGVRGTEFFVAYGRRIDEHPDVWLCVNSGAVEVTVPATDQWVVVRQGEGINIVGGTRLTKPRRYGWTRRLNWNTDPGRGEVIDRTDLDQAYSDLLDQDYR